MTSATIQSSENMFSKEDRNELPRESSCTNSQESYSCYNNSHADPSEYGALWTQLIKKKKKKREENVLNTCFHKDLWNSGKLSYLRV